MNTRRWLIASPRGSTGWKRVSFAILHRKLLQKILRIKRMVTAMRKTLILEREVLARLVRQDFALVTEQEIVYYRNVYDHLVRYNELIESAREMVSDLMQSTCRHLPIASTRS